MSSRSLLRLSLRFTKNIQPALKPLRLASTAQVPVSSSNTSFASSKKELVVWWDSRCPLCTREINLLRSLDSRKVIDFIPISEDSPIPDVKSSSGCPLTKKELLARFHAQEPGGELVSGARAFAKLWRRVPQPQLQWIGRIAEKNTLFMSAMEMSYRAFLVVRPSLQRLAKRLEK